MTWTPYDEVSILRAEHIGLAFPDDLRFLDAPSGGSVAALDASMAGCVMAYLDGVLDPERRSILQECADDLRDVLPRLSGEGAGYAGRLVRMAALIEAVQAAMP
jgi:hypothetical protein